jgi:hypothetical protein
MHDTTGNAWAELGRDVIAVDLDVFLGGGHGVDLDDRWPAAVESKLEIIILWVADKTNLSV